MGADGLRYIRTAKFSQTGNIGVDLFKDLLSMVRALPMLPAADVYVLNSFWSPVFVPLWCGRKPRCVVNVQRMPKGQFWLYKRCHRFSAVSGAVAVALSEENPAYAARTRVIPNPINTDIFVPPSSRTWGQHTKTILYTGRIHPEKGLHVLVRAFAQIHARHPNTVLKLVGPVAEADGGGGGRYMEILRESAGTLPVIFESAIYDRHGLVHELQKAHFYCYPSLAEKGEAFGVAPLEAMATGLPAVVSDLACFRDFATDGETAVVFDHRASDSAARLADAIEKLITDSNLRVRVSNNAAEIAKRFSYEAVADLYLEDFSALLASG